MKILFVCTGNSCRSVMAEYLMRQWAKEGGHQEVTAVSAGTHAWEGSAATAETIAVLREVGIDAGRHRAKRTDRMMIDEADIIVAMTKAHREWMIDQLKAPKAKVVMLREEDVADPIGWPVEGYRECRDLIRQELPRLLKGGANGRPVY